MSNKVTVITASYGHEEYISKAIESVLAQSFTDFEYIIFDDGSKDGSRDIIEEYARKDSRIKFHTHENNANKGLPKTVEKCVSLAQGAYIAFLESDDIWKNTFLEEMLHIAEKRKDVGLFYCGIEVFGDDNENNAKHNNMLNRRKKFIKQESIIRMDFLYERFISTFSSVLVRSEIMKKCQFNPLIPQRLDNFLWIQCLLLMPALYLDKELSLWRKHDSSFSRTMVAPYAFASEDMFFKLLYPEHTKKDMDFYHWLLSGKKEKIFRKQIRAFLRFYFQKKYPYGKINIFTVKEGE